MEWVIVLIVLVGVVLFLRSNNKKQVEEIKRDQIVTDQLSLVRQTTEDDVTAFGMALQELDIELAGRELNEATRADYQRALDCYEISKESLAAVQRADEIRNVTAILDDGRYAIACVRARVAGQELPPRRPPCFFDPQHGQSVRDVFWTPSGGVPREVPACALDAQRVEAGAEPATRQVLLGTRRVPYWEAGPAYAPWATGYFASFAALDILFMGTMMAALVSDGGADSGQADVGDHSDGSDGGGSADSGADGGADASGGYDAGGGYDSGGFDGGGFDGGGFDGGGGF